MTYPTSCKYTMLMASLPPHKKLLFDDNQVSLSRIQLNNRLTLLDDQDAADLLKIEGLLHWSHLKIDLDQTFVQQTIESIASIDNDFIKNIIIWRLELRIILATLRMRHQGQKTPPAKKIFGFDYWYFIITKYWDEPDLGLSKQLPWLAEANELLITNQSFELEKFLFSVVWEHYHRQNFGHYFNFEAVIIYVLRWDIISRWNRNNKELAVKRFNNLVDIGLQNIEL